MKLIKANLYEVYLYKGHNPCHDSYRQFVLANSPEEALEITKKMFKKEEPFEYDDFGVTLNLKDIYSRKNM